MLFPLARVELLMGDWAAARRHARECYEVGERNGQVGEQPYAITIVALVDAHLGLVDSARARIDEGIELAERIGVDPAGFELLAARGFLELSLGNAAAAERALRPGRRAHPLVRLPRPRALPLPRRRDRGQDRRSASATRPERLVSELEQLAARLERPWPLVMAARSRGLLAAALGDAEAASAALEEALALCDRLGEPFERARTLLVLGSVQRRDRKKRPARESLEAALEIFDSLGARLWSERTRSELARIGGRATLAELTPTEERVAELLASGPHLPAGRGRALRQPEDGAVERLEDLPQARNHLARRAHQALRGRLASARDRLGPGRSRGR